MRVRKVLDPDARPQPPYVAEARVLDVLAAEEPGAALSTQDIYQRVEGLGRSAVLDACRRLAGIHPGTLDGLKLERLGVGSATRWRLLAEGGESQ